MILDSLKWRYATKKFDASKKLSDADLQKLIDAFVLTPTSFGLFPFELVIVENPETREKLVAHSWGQRQVAEASHLLILARRTDIDSAYIHHYIEHSASIQGISPDMLKGYEDMMNGALLSRSPEQVATWARNQAYIALGNLMTVAAELQIDSCPMEGFSPADYDTVLGLAAKNLASVVALPVGYRSSEDKYAHGPKVRFDEKDVVIRM